MAVNGIGVAATASGALLVWSGVKGASVSTSLRDLLSGHQPGGAETAALVSSSPPAASPPPPGGSGGQGGNVGLGKLQAASYGWSAGAEWDDLNSLWQRESGWSNTAQNPSSGAYGIPQALPYTKMPKAAWPPSAGGSASASAQISWGLSYIKQRYGSPSAAWAHEQQFGWY